MSRVFRGKFVAGLKRAFRRKALAFYGACLPLAKEKTFHAFVRVLFREDWVVYAKRPFGGPEHVLHYLARYTHRVAISNHRLVDLTDTHVTFLWKDYDGGSNSETSDFWGFEGGWMTAQTIVPLPDQTGDYDIPFYIPPTPWDYAFEVHGNITGTGSSTKRDTAARTRKKTLLLPSLLGKSPRQRPISFRLAPLWPPAKLFWPSLSALMARFAAAGRRTVEGGPRRGDR